MLETSSGVGYKVYEDIKGKKKYMYTMIEDEFGRFNLLYESLYDTKTKDMFGIESRVDDDGNYIMISIDTPSYDRTIYAFGGIVIGDLICVKPKRSKHELYGRVYCSNAITDVIDLHDYLYFKPNYYNNADEEYVPDVETSGVILDFMDAGKVLKSDVLLSMKPTEGEK